MAYNYVYHIALGGYGETAFFLDDYTSNGSVHHNNQQATRTTA